MFAWEVTLFRLFFIFVLLSQSAYAGADNRFSGIVINTSCELNFPTVTISLESVGSYLVMSGKSSEYEASRNDCQSIQDVWATLPAGRELVLEASVNGDPPIITSFKVRIRCPSSEGKCE